MKLGDATPEDVVYLAKKVRKLQGKVNDLYKVIGMIFKVKYCDEDISKVA